MSTSSTVSTGKPHVVVIAGGLGHERDVSIRSGTRVVNNLRRAGMTVDMVDFDSQLMGRLEELKPDVVFPLVHGALGEDGSLATLLTLAEIPFVGTTGAQALPASNKASFKAICLANGLPTPPFISLSHELFRQQGSAPLLAAVKKTLTFPLVVKPAVGGSAQGVTIVREESDLPEAFVMAFAYCDSVIVEKFIEGRELAVSVVSFGEYDDLSQDFDVEEFLETLENSDNPDDLDAADWAGDDSGIDIRALPIVEIVSDGPYDFDARYNPGRAEFFTPARLPEAKSEEVKALALFVHSLFTLRHFSRTDMIVDSEGTPWVIDVNVAPGMTDTSLFPQAAHADGTYENLLVELVNAALEAGPVSL
ncbi:MAG: ATP-grasp domain-containing protein [Actinomycetaceae bacterium]|nr:ATP-grasp domain-containing protein [Actinomycetaceae bacterium]